jgi:hypothetical protein
MKLKYILKSLLLAITASLFVSTSLLALERKAEILGSRVSIHVAPDADSKTVAHVNRGVVVDVIGRGEEPTKVVKFTQYWYKVSYRGKAGWVFGQFLNLDSNKVGLTRVFTRSELIKYCDIETANLKRTREAGAHEALIEFSRAFLQDLKDISEDAILSPYYGDLDGYRALNAYYLALGYLGTGNVDGAMELTDQISNLFDGIDLPDGRKSGDIIFELKSLIEEKRGRKSGGD